MNTRKPMLQRAPYLRALAVCSVSIWALAFAAQARAADEAAPAAPEKVTQVEEIVVTAQHRKENLQVVPISAQVVTGVQQVEQNLNDLPDVAETTPSIHIGNNGRSSELYIRGIGSGVNQVFDQSVGTFIDDVYHGRSRVTTATFLDLDRIEILKGPQSTFFGNNAIAGALNIVTAQPTDVFGGWGRVLYGSYGQYAVEGAINGPLGDKLDGRAAFTVNGGNGWLDDVANGMHVPQERNEGGRLALKFKPSDDFDATLKLEATDNNNRGALPIEWSSCPPPAPFVAKGFCASSLAGGLPVGLSNNNVARSPGQFISLQTQDAVLTMNEKTPIGVLTSVTGYYAYHFNMNLDPDATPAIAISNQTPEHYDQFSQEVRLTSPVGQTFEYLVGAYYQSDKLFVRQDAGYFFLTPTFASKPALAALVPYLPLGQRISAYQNEDSYAVFGSLTWNLTDRFRLVAGLRGDWDHKDTTRTVSWGTAGAPYGDIIPLPTAIQPIAQTAASLVGLGVAGTLSGGRTDNAWMPSLKAQYQITPNAMAYVSYARGFKAGGFNGVDTTGNAATFAFLPEYVNAYEAGLKSEWFDRRLLVNLALFRSDYSNLQVAILIPNGANFLNVVQNAADSRSEGLEGEFEWIVSQSFTLRAEGTLMDAYYVSYPAAGPTSLQQFNHVAFQNLAGRPTAYAPRASGSLTADYHTRLPNDYRLELSATEIYSSSYYLSSTDDPLLAQSAYTRLDARATIETPDGRWGFDVIGKNLTNATIANFGIAAPSSLGSVFKSKEEPISVVAQIRVRW